MLSKLCSRLGLRAYNRNQRVTPHVSYGCTSPVDDRVYRARESSFVSEAVFHGVTMMQPGVSDNFAAEFKDLHEWCLNVTISTIIKVFIMDSG
jgi:hypothetical protein